MTTMNDIEAACKAARQARDRATQRATMLNESIEELRRKHIPLLKKDAERIAEADAALLGLLQGAAHLFTRPKSQVFHGLQVGFKNGSGAITFDDPAQVVKAIRKHLADKVDTLIKVKETPIKAAIRNLTGAELQKIGVRAEPGGEVVFIHEPASDSSKLLAAFLKGEEAEREEAEAAA